MTDESRAVYISGIEAAVERHCEPHDGYPDMDDIYDTIAPLIAAEVAAAVAESKAATELEFRDYRDRLSAAGAEQMRLTAVIEDLKAAAHASGDSPVTDPS